MSEELTSDNFRETLPLLNSGRIELLDHPRLIAQLIGLERRTSRLGKDTISHPPSGHDDIATAVCGAALPPLGTRRSRAPRARGARRAGWRRGSRTRERSANEVCCPLSRASITESSEGRRSATHDVQLPVAGFAA